MKKAIKIFDGVAIVVFIMMVSVVIWQVITRFLLHMNAPWTEELSRLLFIYVGFMGTAIATREKELIVVDIVLSRLPQRMRTVFDVIIQIFTFVFFTIVLVGALKMFMTTKSTYFQSMPWLSNGWTYMAVIIGMTASLLAILVNGVNHIKEVFKK